MTKIHLPQEIMVEILAWLPVKSLARFRCVSKCWYSLTHDNVFVELHQRRAAERPSIIIKPRALQSTQARFYSFEVEGAFMDHFTIGGLNWEKEYELANSVHGLTCLYGDTNCYLVNPGMREFVLLPEFHCRDVALSNVGLGFDTSVGEYKLVRLFVQENVYDASASCEILSLGDDHWRYIGEVSYFSIHNPVFLHGILYWMPIIDESSEPVIILSFDIKQEKFVEIPGPPNCLQPSSQYLHVAPIGENLCFVQSHTQNLYIELWVLKDYTNHVWSKDYSIDLQMLVDFSSNSLPVHVVGDPNGKVLICSSAECCYCYDHHSKTFQRIFYCVYGEFLVQSESLISPRTLLGLSEATYAS